MPGKWINRTRRPRFYVYEVLGRDGLILYIGKGSGSRMHTSRRRVGGASVRTFAWLWDEADAYSLERERIALLRPPENLAPGGGGSWSTARSMPRIPMDADARLMRKIGTRAYAARIVLHALCMAPHLFPTTPTASEVGQLRSVAYG